MKTKKKHRKQDKSENRTKYRNKEEENKNIKTRLKMP